jgi:hypothetical protein
MAATASKNSQLNAKTANSSSSSLDPHEAIFLPGGKCSLLFPVDKNVWLFVQKRYHLDAFALEVVKKKMSIRLFEFFALCFWQIQVDCNYRALLVWRFRFRSRGFLQSTCRRKPGYGRSPDCTGSTVKSSWNACQWSWTFRRSSVSTRFRR